MAQQWHKVTDVAAFLRQGRTVRGRHEFTGRVLHWPFCKHCGLLCLRNDATRRAMNAACVRLED